MMKKSLFIVLILVFLLFIGCIVNISNNKENLIKIGVIIYKYDDNFMFYVCCYIELSVNVKVRLFINDL